MVNKKYINENMHMFRLISGSTNKVYTFDYDNEKYILKNWYRSKEELSHFGSS